MCFGDDALTTRIGRCIAAVALVAGCAAFAQDTAPRGGGLVPTPRKTREELVREWDLNSDGKIDQGEAEVASSRMRRERAELRLNSGIDPVTGLPRGEPAPAAPAADDDAPADPQPEPTEPAGKDRDDAPRLPGTRVPRPTVPGTDRSGSGAKASGQPAPTTGTRATADLKRQPVTGGVRAGGLPARAGYGAGVPAAPLNAGLPIVPRQRPGAAAARGGLVPTPRPASPAPASRPTGARDLYDPY